MKIRLVLCALLFLTHFSFSKPVNGKIIAVGNNLTWVKVWGTHYERGYAQGYLLASQINLMYKSYITPKFGTVLPLAKQIIADTNSFKIDSVFWAEANGVAAGMAAAGVTGYDGTDLLVANSLLDLASMMTPKYKIDLNLGCSSLMSWGDATAGTALSGKSVISRHLDWEINSILIGNQVAVAHIPSDATEQPWLMIGFAGQISVLSGTNKAGLSTFQHVLQGVTGKPTTGKKYEPIWFSLRKGLEQKDFNKDGKCNVEDIRSVLLSNVNGYATSCIIPALASATNVSDSLIALVGEVTFSSPTHSFRTNSYEDAIPGDNLYAANSPIVRNNARLYCNRYAATKNGVGDGLLLDSLKNWTVLRDSSRVTGNNLQFIQVIPELKALKISTYKYNNPAYLQDPFYYNLDTIFAQPSSIEDHLNGGAPSAFGLTQNYPNPFNPVTAIEYNIGPNIEGAQTPVTLKIYDILGKEIITLVNEIQALGQHKVFWNAQNCPSGIYYCELRAGALREVRKMTLLK